MSGCARLQSVNLSPLLARPRASDFFVSVFEERAKRTRLTSDDALKTTISTWLCEQSSEFYENGIRKLISCWQRCISVNGDYIEV